MEKILHNFKAPPKELFFTKNDPFDPRLGEVFKWQENPTSEMKFGLFGYEDDEGIEKNGGRVGARLAPNEIRKWLYRMTPPMGFSKSAFDGGNLRPENLELRDRHEVAALNLKTFFKSGQKALTFGGGHDYGYADGKAFLETFSGFKEKPLVINFDAHLDVRDLEKGLTSGTPFFRLREEFKEFEMVQIGIQNQCNSQKHLKWCKEHNIDVLPLEDFYGKRDSLKEIFERTWVHHVTKTRPTFISVDIDGFSSNFAPGCSQSWPTGIEPKEFFQLFDWLQQELDVKLLSIYEVSPPLDVAHVTAKLASQIAYRFLEDSCKTS